MQLTQQQTAELTAHVKKWANIEGDYEATMLGGIAHFKADSGIFEDALSTADRDWITANTQVDGKLLEKYCIDEEMCDYTDEYYDLICNAEELQCNKAMEEMQAICEKYDLCDEAVACECAKIEEEL